MIRRASAADRLLALVDQRSQAVRVFLDAFRQAAPSFFVTVTHPSHSGCFAVPSKCCVRLVELVAGRSCAAARVFASSAARLLLGQRLERTRGLERLLQDRSCESQPVITTLVGRFIA